MKSTTSVTDSVCGMDIETATAAGRTEYNGQAYYFCGSKCKEKFDLNPEQYLGKSAGTPKSEHGCKCCPFNYLYPHHSASPSVCSVSRGLRHFTHPFGRTMEMKGERTVEKANAAAAPQANQGNLRERLQSVAVEGD